MDFKKFKRLRLMLHIGVAAVIAAALLLLCAAIFGLSDSGSAVAVIAAGMVLAIIGCLFVVFWNIKTRRYCAWNIKAVYNNVKKYHALPYREIDGYAKELEIIRKNYAEDTAENKNIINCDSLRKNFLFRKNREDIEKLSDYSVLSTGKIYYGYYADSFLSLHTPADSTKVGIMKVLYSTDDYYAEHPEELKEVLENFADYKKDGIDGFEKLIDMFEFAFKLPAEVTNGREVYLTTAVAARSKLPTGYVANKVIPVIVSPENSTSAFAVDCKYWGENFVANFAFKDDEFKYVQYNADRIANFTQHTCGDYAAELENIQKKYTSDRENEPVDLLGENPFPMLKFSNVKFYYAYILDCNAKKLEGMPYVGLYSTDKFFKSNPGKLKDIAQTLKNDESAKSGIAEVLNYRRREIRTYKLPYSLTDGRNVLATAVFADKEKLPLYKFTDNPVPVVYSSKDGEEGFLYLADCKYWSDGFTYEYVNADA